MRSVGGRNAGWPAASGGARRRVLVTATVAALALLVAACSGGLARHGPPAAEITIAPANGTENAKPDDGVTVTAARGVLENVTVSQGSDPVTGALNASRTTWQSTWALQPSRGYTVTATAVSKSGKTVTGTSSFRTLTPARTFSAQTVIGDDQTYGVGMPIDLTFSAPVKNEAAVERSVQLWASKPVVGAWYWDTRESLMFRPRFYWRPHTRVRFVAHLDGLEASPGVYGTADLSQSFEIGNSLIAVVNTADHDARIYYRGKLLGDWPASTGSPGDDTANGTYLTIEKANPALMSGPGYTDFPVPYSVRFTWSGNYMHDAYWSVGEQGYENVSHGCVNLSPEDAEIYYNLAVPGDPVTVIGSPAAGVWDDGWTEWFLSWHRLLAAARPTRPSRQGRPAVSSSTRWRSRGEAPGRRSPPRAPGTISPAEWRSAQPQPRRARAKGRSWVDALAQPDNGIILR